MKTQTSWVVSVCEEFSDWVMFDGRNKSLIVNLDEEYLHTLKKELKRLGYNVVHETKFTDKTDSSVNVTCAFMYGK